MKYEDIKDFSQRCEEHPAHQNGMVSYQMIQARLDEEIAELREYIETQLAQLEQEPVAAVTSETGADISMSWWHEPALPVGTKLYTTPPQRKPLTDEEIWKFWWARPKVQDGEDDSMEAEFVAAVRAVLAAHGIKE